MVEELRRKGKEEVERKEGSGRERGKEGGKEEEEFKGEGGS